MCWLFSFFHFTFNMFSCTSVSLCSDFFVLSLGPTLLLSIAPCLCGLTARNETDKSKVSLEEEEWSRGDLSKQMWNATEGRDVNTLLWINIISTMPRSLGEALNWVRNSHSLPLREVTQSLSFEVFQSILLLGPNNYYFQVGKNLVPPVL